MTGIHPGALITFHRPVAFWLGVFAVVAGVIAHFPMFIQAAEMNFHMAGMKMSLLMTVGMYAVIVGTVICAYGLLPKTYFADPDAHPEAAARLRPLDDAPLTPAHWKLITVLVIALIVDILKPATLGFVVPGAAEEYGLTKAQVALMPLGGIVGTTVGSLVWGYLGDLIGRRASILLAAIVFIGTSICGAMPSFSWNVIMCFIMGLGAGGMLPIAFALLAETVPASQRGWLIVLVGGIGTVGGYLLASGSAALLEPIFGWRILWFLGLPTGVILLLLNRYIPESPRYLMVHGKTAEALKVMAYFGVQVADPAPAGRESASAASRAAIGAPQPGRFAELFRGGLSSLTVSLSVYGLAWGLVNFGFLLWLPLHLRSMGMGVAASDAILAKSALIAFPATVLVAWLYHSWSTRNSLVLFALLTAVSLVGFTVVELEHAESTFLLGLLLVALLVSSSATVAMLTPYTTEIYPSHIRATGSGWVAGCGKFAGVVALGAAVAGLTPGITAAAVIVTVPTLVAASMIARVGIETRQRNLEDIQAT